MNGILNQSRKTCEWRSEHSWSAQTFRVRGWTPSGPADLFTWRLLNCCGTSSTLMTIAELQSSRLLCARDDRKFSWAEEKSDSSNLAKNCFVSCTFISEPRRPESLVPQPVMERRLPASSHRQLQLQRSTHVTCHMTHSPHPPIVPSHFGGLFLLQESPDSASAVIASLPPQHPAADSDGVSLSFAHHSSTWCKLTCGEWWGRSLDAKHRTCICLFAASVNISTWVWLKQISYLSKGPLCY